MTTASAGPTIAERARRGAELATVPSLPRADWPAQVAWYDKDGYQHVTRFEYATDQSCTLTVGAQEEGRVGCVTRSVTVDEQGEQVVATHGYDAERRLVDDLKVRWDGGLAVGTYELPVYRSLDGAPNGPNLGLRNPQDDGFTARYRVEGERLIDRYRAHADSAEAPSTPTTSLTWSTTRLLEIRTPFLHGYLEYPDTPPPERAETTARKARELADREVAALGTVAAVPRRDWPCTRTQTWDDGEVVRDTFEYDPKRTSCLLPIGKVAEGMIGCPVAIVSERTLADGTRSNPERQAIYYQGDHVRTRRRLDGLFVGTPNGPFTRTAAGFRTTEDGESTEYELAKGTLTKVANSGARVSLSWRGARLEALVTETSLGGRQRANTTFTYDCKP